MNRLIRGRIAAAKKRESFLSRESGIDLRLSSLKRLILIIKKLRTPEIGCAWDLKQSNETLKNSLIEEAYEAVQSIEDLKLDSIKEELGDLLFVVLMHIHVAEQNGILDFTEVLNQISDKLVRRHPHIFSDLKVDSSEEILRNWETIKRSEKKNRDTKTLLKDVPRSMPSLLRIGRMLNKMDRLGELQTDVNIAVEDIKKYIKILDDNDVKKYASAITGILYQISVLAYKNGIDPENEFQARITSMIHS